MLLTLVKLQTSLHPITLPDANTVTPAPLHNLAFTPHELPDK